MKRDFIYSLVVALLIGLTLGFVVENIYAIKKGVYAIAVKLEAIETEASK